MNVSLMYLEVAVVGLALGILLLDLWTPSHLKPKLGYVAALGLLCILGASFSQEIASSGSVAFGGIYVQDGLALFFKRLFLVAAILVLLLAVEYAGRIRTGISEYYVIMLFALSGMMLSASANDFVMLFVSMELITVSFYILVSFQRSRMGSLEAGVKYLILGALSTAFVVFGIAFVFGISSSTSFAEVQAKVPELASNKMFWLGILFVLIGLGFKIAAFPLQIWAPDVYQGAPTPTTAFLAIGSKAAGFILLMRVLFVAVPNVTVQWEKILIVVAAITILYGNLCAIPQRNLKRLLGYSSIANAGYVLLGVTALNQAGAAAILYYLAGYLFTLIAAFTVIALVAPEDEDVSCLAGLNQRAPFLAASIAIAMVSLGGIPPLAGFFGKFLLLKAVIEQASTNTAYIWLAVIAIAGVVISLYYYFGVIRVIYWSKEPADLSPLRVSWPMKISLAVCLIGMLYLGIYPSAALRTAEQAVVVLKF